MYVGVIPDDLSLLALDDGIPHVRGGDPHYKVAGHDNIYVFPMYVGVIPQLQGDYNTWQSIPHVRGGDPPISVRRAVQVEYSPCTWG